MLTRYLQGQASTQMSENSITRAYQVLKLEKIIGNPVFSKLLHMINQLPILTKPFLSRKELTDPSLALALRIEKKTTCHQLISISYLLDLGNISTNQRLEMAHHLQQCLVGELTSDLKQGEMLQVQDNTTQLFLMWESQCQASVFLRKTEMVSFISSKTHQELAPTSRKIL